MSNELKIILNRLKFKTGKTIEEIAKDIKYSRSYLNSEVNKGNNEEIKNKMLDYETKLNTATPEKQDQSDNTTLADLASANKALAEAQKIFAEAYFRLKIFASV